MDISVRHPMYAFNAVQWIKWRLTYAGGESFRLHYLRKFNHREDDADFETRRMMTPVPSFAKAAINEIRNAIFQRLRDIIRTSGSETYQDSISGITGGVDRRGSTMNAFLGMGALSELLVMGKCGIFVDNVPDVSQTVTAKPSTRPYLYCYAIEDILSFSCNQADNPAEFQSILLRDHTMTYDEVTGLPVVTAERVRHLWLNDGKVQCQFYDEKGVESQPVVTLNLTKIPFVLLDIGDSLLRDVCDHQIALLNLTSSDVAYALRANYPFLVKPEDGRSGGGYLKHGTEGTATTGGQPAGDEDVRAGVTHGITYPAGATPPQFINPSAEPLKASMELQDSLKNDIRELVNLAVKSLATRASAESKSLDNQGLEAGLSYIGLVLENGERQIAEFWAAYEEQKVDRRQVPTIKYPDRYSLKTDDDRLSESEKLAAVVTDVPGRTVKREVAKLIVNTLLSGKVSVGVVQTICKEIDTAPYITSDPKTIFSAIENGALSLATAAEALGFDADEPGKAADDHAARIARIAELQGVKAAARGIDKQIQTDAQDSGINAAARGINELDAGSNTAADEKTSSQTPDLQDNATKKVRGEGK